jgi:sulfur carrier protein
MGRRRREGTVFGALLGLCTRLATLRVSALPGVLPSGAARGMVKAAMPTLTVNGEPREINAPMTVAALLEKHRLRPAMVVVELNREILPRDRYGDTLLQEGDTLEIVQMMAGG